MSLKVHNGDLYVETMQEADWSPSYAQKEMMRKEQISESYKQREVQRALQEHHRRQQLIGPHPSNKGPHTSGFIGRYRHTGGHDSEDIALRQYKEESVSAKRAILEAELKAKMDIISKEASRRAQEKALRKATMFEEKLAEFIDRNQEIMEKGLMHEDAGKVIERRRKKQYQDWMANVFLPMQQEINKKIDATDINQIRRTRNEYFDDFILECNKRNNLTNLGPSIIHSKRLIEERGPKGSEESISGIYDRPSLSLKTNSTKSEDTTENITDNNNIHDRRYCPVGSTTVTEACTIRYRPISIANDPIKNRQTREMTKPNGASYQEDTLTAVLREVEGSSHSKRQSTNNTNNNANNNNANNNNANTDGRLYTSTESSYNDKGYHGTKDIAIFDKSISNSHYNFLPSIYTADDCTVVGQYQQGDIRLSPVKNIKVYDNNNNSIITRNPAVAVTESTHLYPRGGDTIFKYSNNNTLFAINKGKGGNLSRSALVDVSKWNIMEDTPICRYSLDTNNPVHRRAGTNKDYMKSAIIMDHYGTYDGKDKVSISNSAFPMHRGKRTVITQVVRDMKHPNEMKKN